MSDWTCEHVEEWIDLYAAGEADAPTRAAVGRHLKACPSCAESHGQAQQLLGLLDQRFQESERLKRLWSRLEAQPKQARPPMRLGLWRAAALAASVLLTFGLSGWLGLGQALPSAGPQLTAVLNPPTARFVPGAMEAMGAPNEVAIKTADAVPPGRQESTEPEYPATPLPAGRAAAPPPPDVNLVLKIDNPDRDALSLCFGDARTKLILDLRGPGARDVAAPSAAPPLADLKDVRIAPGATYYLTIHQLAYGGRGAVHYLYWTSPGEYTLTVTLRAWVEADARAGGREVVTTSGPLKIHVRGPALTVCGGG